MRAATLLWARIVRLWTRFCKLLEWKGCGNVLTSCRYRSGTGVQLTARTFEYASERFLQANGSILSDHNPVLVNFDWKKV